MAQLDIELSGVNTAVARLEREIELLREYLTRLVFDVVTGALDVREVLLRLPESIEVHVTDVGTDGNDDAELTDEEAEA